MPTDQCKISKTVVQMTGFEPASLIWQKAVCFQLQHIYITVKYSLQSDVDCLVKTKSVDD